MGLFFSVKTEADRKLLRDYDAAVAEFRDRVADAMENAATKEPSVAKPMLAAAAALRSRPLPSEANRDPDALRRLTLSSLTVETAFSKLKDYANSDAALANAMTVTVKMREISKETIGKPAFRPLTDAVLKAVAEQKPAVAREMEQKVFDLYIGEITAKPPTKGAAAMTEEAKKPEVKKGLVGVYVDDSKVSKIVQETNSLTYRGYAVQDLAANCKFEEVAYLMWNGELPTKQELAAFEKTERSLRKIDDTLVDVLKKLRPDAHPMDVLRTAISFLGAQDPNWADESKQANLEKSINMMAKLPTIVAAWSRIRNGEEPIAPRDDLSYSENFFHMTSGKVPEPAVVAAFDKSMILYAEHSFNVSTFTARTITSSLSDIYSAVTGAIGSLKGRLHGGANEAVLDVINEIGEPSKAKAWLDDAIAQKKTIMGFGHRVYKNGDSRVPTLRNAFNEVAALRGDTKIGQIMDILEKGMLEQKNIKPNVDFPAAGLYHLMGIEKDMYTPLFVMARITGWTAHVMEQLEDNKLIRPLNTYSGEAQRQVPPMAGRGKKAAPAP